MRITPDCYGCTLSFTINAARLAENIDRGTEMSAVREALRVLRELPDDATPADACTVCLEVAQQVTGERDPYRDERQKYNRLAAGLLPGLRKRIDEAEKEGQDRLLTAVLLAIAGNIIDHGIISNPDVEGTIERVLSAGLAMNDFDYFKISLEKANTVVYVGDNCGEIAFDRLVCEEILRISSGRAKIRFAVKPAPILNDATREDALQVGIDEVAEIIDIGSATVGMPIDRVSKEFLAELAAADVVIAKGQGNFETAEEYVTHIRGAYFCVLTAKCIPVAKEIGVPQWGAVLLDVKKRYLGAS